MINIVIITIVMIKMNDFLLYELKLSLQLMKTLIIIIDITE